MAKSLQGATRLEHRERGSVYSTARRMASCLKDSGTRQWVNRTSENDTQPELDPAAFVRSTGTLYSLPQEGAGSVGPLALALTAAMVGVLDEAANLCRWRDFPDLYSHYGSRHQGHRLSRCNRVMGGSPSSRTRESRTRQQR